MHRQLFQEPQPLPLGLEPELVQIARDRAATLRLPQRQARRNMPAGRVARRGVETSPQACLDQHDAGLALTLAWDKKCAGGTDEHSGHSCAQSSLDRGAFACFFVLQM